MRYEPHRRRDLVDFLDGSLDPAARDAFDAHLLSCNDCWSAVQQDRRGRQAAESLREVAPPALRDRIRITMEIATHDQHRAEWRSRTRRGALMLAGLLPVLLVLVGGVIRLERQVPADPPAVAAVLHLARTLPPSLSPAGQNEQRRTFVVGGQPLSVHHLHLDGRDVVVAVSTRHFPMPMRAQPLTAGEDAPWLATRGPLGLACFTRPVPMLLAGRMPAERLARLATRFPLDEIQAMSPAANAIPPK
jgi:hypothetical protein